MVVEYGLAVIRESATPASGRNIRRADVEISKIVDIDLCIGCKACEVACKEWNDLDAEETHNFGSYQSHTDLSAATWDLMRFNEVDMPDGSLAWLIKKDSCLHCAEPGCLLACPAPGAVVQYENGIVDFNQKYCIGCQYCVAGCPFDIPRFDKETKKVYKCTLCIDRVSNGLEPACVKACPTGSIKFGTKMEMVEYGTKKVEKLKKRGFSEALLYDPAGVGGVHMMYVVPHGGMLEEYDIPKDPKVPGSFPTTYLTWLSFFRKIGSVSMWAGLIGAFLFYLRTGRKYPPPEEEAVEHAYEMERTVDDGDADADASPVGDGEAPRADGEAGDGQAAGGQAGDGRGFDGQAGDGDGEKRRAPAGDGADAVTQSEEPGRR